MKTVREIREEAARCSQWSEGRRRRFAELPKNLHDLAWEKDLDIGFCPSNFLVQEKGYYLFSEAEESPIFLGANAKEAARHLEGGNDLHSVH